MKSRLFHSLILEQQSLEARAGTSLQDLSHRGYQWLVSCRISCRISGGLRFNSLLSCEPELLLFQATALSSYQSLKLLLCQAIFLLSYYSVKLLL